MPSKAYSRTVTVERTGNYRGTRASHFYVNSFHNKPEYPTRIKENPLVLHISDTFGCRWIQRFNDGFQLYHSLDALNNTPFYRALETPWNQRLYAGVYAKFFAAANQGSAEWGINIFTARQSLKTLVQLATTAASAVDNLLKAHRVGVKWLNRHPTATQTALKALTKRRGRDLVRAKTKRERSRIQMELNTLDQVTKTLLAWRYGVKPLMDDIFATAEILSGEFKDDVALRKSARVLWNGTGDWGQDKWSGTESVVLRATCSQSNPNLNLAKRLGLINPATVLWDKSPWSFVVDWWFPVGTFFSNLTASVGLSLSGSSITRTRTWNGVLAFPKNPSFTDNFEGDARFHGKRKVREVGPLPIPLSVPYGTGLGIQRGQNAIALITQKLLRK